MPHQTHCCDIQFTNAALESAAQTLAHKLRLSLHDPSHPLPFSLRIDDSGLTLLNHQDKQHKPMQINFDTPALQHRIRQQGWRNERLARAVGFKHNPTPTVVDATAGFGQDAYVLASLGANVILIERSPVMAALLEDAIQRAQAAGSTTARRMTLQHGDASVILPTLKGQCDVVTLDPMYPHSNKNALPKKRMQQLRQLIGDDHDAGDCLAIACECAPRVVVKRPRHAEPLDNLKPSESLTGTAARFDIYFQEQ